MVEGSECRVGTELLQTFPGQALKYHRVKMLSGTALRPVVHLKYSTGAKTQGTSYSLGSFFKR